MSTFVNERECAIHEKVEPWEGENPYQCFECGHVYADEDTITAQYKETYPKFSDLKDIDLGFYPLCLHDW